MIKLVASALTVASLLSLAACHTVHGNPPVVAECAAPQPGEGIRSGPALVGQNYGMQMTAIPINSVQFDSHATARAIAVQQLFARRTASDTVEVTARFVACGDELSTVRVRTSFLRADHAPAEMPSAWQQLHLGPRMTAVYREFSTSRDVAGYLLEVAR
jgi:hypothetical protein